MGGETGQELSDRRAHLGAGRRYDRDAGRYPVEPGVMDDVDDLRWTGPADHLDAVCAHIDAPRVAERARRLAAELARDS